MLFFPPSRNMGGFSFKPQFPFPDFIAAVLFLHLPKLAIQLFPPLFFLSFSSKSGPDCSALPRPLSPPSSPLERPLGRGSMASSPLPSLVKELRAFFCAPPSFFSDVGSRRPSVAFSPFFQYTALSRFPGADLDSLGEGNFAFPPPPNSIYIPQPLLVLVSVLPRLRKCPSFSENHPRLHFRSSGQ